MERASPANSPYPSRKAVESDPGRSCSFCGKSWDRPLSICRCELVRYCDRECQKNAWQDHKRKCRLKADQEVGEMSTDQVVLNLILRDTESRDGPGGEYQRTSLLERLLKDPQKACHIGEASSYIIHTWSYPWKDLVAALNDTLMDLDRFVWLDAICINQHEALVKELPDWWYYGIHDVIQACHFVELVLMPWDRPMPVERAWCVWEMVGAQAKSLDQIRVLTSPHDHKRLEKGLRQGRLAYENFQRAFADINIERATATNEGDTKRLVKEIKRLGTVKVNDVVLLPVKKWLMDTVVNINVESWSRVERCNYITCRGELLHALGKLEAATECFISALDESVAMAQDNDANARVIAALNNLAAVYMDMGRYDAAEMVLNRAIQACKRLYGSEGSARENSQLAMTLGNCGLNLHHLGKHAQAKLLYDEAIAIDVATKSTDPERAVRLNNSAKLLQDMGDYKLAKARFEASLPIIREANGEDSPSFATLQNNLALLACAMGNTDEAKSMFERALASLKRSLGSSHPTVAGAMNNIAALHCDLGNVAVAEFYFQEALKIQKDTLGDQHPDVATTMNNLASVHSNNGNTEKAFELGKEALRIWTLSTGRNSPQTKAARKLWGGDAPIIQGSPMHRLVMSPSMHTPNCTPNSPLLRKAIQTRQRTALSTGTDHSPMHRQAAEQALDSVRVSRASSAAASTDSARKAKRPSKSRLGTVSRTSPVPGASFDQVVAMLGLDSGPVVATSLAAGPKVTTKTLAEITEASPGRDADSQDSGSEFDFQKLAATMSIDGPKVD